MSAVLAGISCQLLLFCAVHLLGDLQIIAYVIDDNGPRFLLGLEMATRMAISFQPVLYRTHDIWSFLGFLSRLESGPKIPPLYSACGWA